jgi:hypothetical protein
MALDRHHSRRVPPSAPRGAWSCRRAPRTGRARARRAAGEQPGDRHRRARLRHERPCVPQRRAEGVEGPSSTSPRGDRSMRLATGSSARAPPRSCAGCWRAARLGRRLPAASSARAVSGRARPTTVGDPLGCEWRSAASAACVGQRADQRAALARAAAQHGVDEPGAAGRRRALTSSTDSPTAACAGRRRGTAAGRGRAAGREDGGLEALRRAAGQRRSTVVQRRAALDGAVGELGGQCPLTPSRPAPRLAVQRAVGPCVVLEDAPQDVECAGACGGSGHGAAGRSEGRSRSSNVRPVPVKSP